jgi:lipoyl(octanoyl) transferase
MVKKAQLWILNTSSREVLIFKTSEKRGGFWQPVTGKVEEGETPLEAAFREGNEETGLTLTSIEALNFEFEFVGRWGRAFETCFLASLSWDQIQDKKIVIDPREHVEFRWVSIETAKNMIKFETNLEALKRVALRL